jgi:integrase
MTSIEEWKKLNEELRAEAEEADRLFKERIEKLRGMKPKELPAVLAHWERQAKDNRGVDPESTKKRKTAEIWVKAISFLLENPNLIGANLSGATATISPSATIQTVVATPPTTGASFKSFSEDYLKYVKNNFAAGTLANAERVMKFFVEMFGDHDLGSFTLEHLEKFKAKRTEAGVSRTTINIDIRTIKAAFAIALDWERLTRNPFVKAKQLKVDEKAKRVLSQEEFERLLNAIEETWLHDIIAFNVLTGLRLGEIMNLKWHDFDPVKQTITVQSSEGYRVKGGKMRVVPIGQDGLDLLNSIRRKGEWIFAGDKGKHYTDDYVSRKFKAYVRKLGLPEEIHYHRLRDTYCTWMADQNVPPHIIKALAGHSSIRVTEKYITPNEEAKKEAAGKIGLHSASKPKEEKGKNSDEKKP